MAKITSGRIGWGTIRGHSDAFFSHSGWVHVILQEFNFPCFSFHFPVFLLISFAFSLPSSVNFPIVFVFIVLFIVPVFFLFLLVYTPFYTIACSLFISPFLSFPSLVSLFWSLTLHYVYCRLFPLFLLVCLIFFHFTRYWHHFGYLSCISNFISNFWNSSIQSPLCSPVMFYLPLSFILYSLLFIQLALASDLFSLLLLLPLPFVSLLFCLSSSFTYICVLPFTFSQVFFVHVSFSYLSIPLYLTLSYILSYIVMC